MKLQTAILIISMTFLSGCCYEDATATKCASAYCINTSYVENETGWKCSLCTYECSTTNCLNIQESTSIYTEPYDCGNHMFKCREKKCTNAGNTTNTSTDGVKIYDCSDIKINHSEQACTC